MQAQSTTCRRKKPILYHGGDVIPVRWTATPSVSTPRPQLRIAFQGAPKCVLAGPTSGLDKPLRPFTGIKMNFLQKPVSCPQISVAEPVVEVKLDRPMMVASKPKKAKKPMPKGDAKVREIVTGPALPVKGSGKNGGPGWDG